MQISLDEIVSIKKLDPIQTIDITVSGDNLFLANGILTHNCGINNTDVDMTNTSESIGLPQTVDMLFALIGTEELDNLNQILVKQIKNRYNDVNYFKRFVLGLDKSRMRFYDLEASAQKDISGSGQQTEDAYNKFKQKTDGDYNGFKF